MSFEQQYSGNDQVNVKDRAAETNPQLNLIDLQNGSQKCGQDASRNNGSADQHLPGLSIYDGGDGGDGAHSHHSDPSSAETSMTGGGSNATPTENTTHSTLASGQSSEAGMSGTTQSTASGASESNILQNLQTDLTNLGNVMQQFTTDLTSAETGLAQLGDTQQPSTTGSDNAGTSGSTDSSNSSSGASFMQQLQSLMSYLGIPSANNSSSESTAGTPASNSDTTPPASTISTAAGDAPPVVNNGTQPTDSTQPTTIQNNNPAPGNASSTNDGTPTNNTAATDPIFNALQAQSPEAAQILSASQPNMSAAGYSNFESALSQTVNGGQYTDVASAGAAAALMLQQSGDSSDSAIAVNAINSVINQNGDAQLGNSTTPPADATTPAPPADTTTPTLPADTTPIPPADTTTPTPPADTTTPTLPADTTPIPPADTTTTPPADTTTTPPADTTTPPPAGTTGPDVNAVQGTGGPAQQNPGQWTQETYDGMNYEVMLPQNYNPSEQYSAVMYEHQLDMGSDWNDGQNNGTDIQSEITPWINTLDQQAQTLGQNAPIVVVPLLDQSSDPSGDSLNFGGITNGDNPGQQQAMSVLQNVTKEYSVNPSQIYAFGASMGAQGIEQQMIDYNDENGTEGKVFAGAITFAGGIEESGQVPTASDVSAMQDAHLWSVHGTDDQEVPVAWDQNMAADMTNNPNYTLTQVQGAGHDVWDDPSTGPQNPQYFNWLLQQEAPDPTTFQTQF